MGAEPGFLSSHTAVSGGTLVQLAPHIQVLNGETAVNACSLMSINPSDGKAHLCDSDTVNFIPAGFAATDNPMSTNVDDTSKITLIRQGRIKGFSGLVPGAPYYPSADTAGAVVPERGLAGPVISAMSAEAGSGFLRNVHVRAGHRPAAGDWTITFPTAATCTVTPPGGSAGAACTVAANTAYNGTITGAGDFYIQTATIESGDSATINVSYSTEGAVAETLDSPSNAFAAFAVIPGAAGKLLRKGIYKVVTTETAVTVGFNGGSQSAARTIAAGTTYCDIIPGVAMKTQDSAVTAETNYYIVDTQEPVPQVGIAVNENTLQVAMGGIG